MYCSSPDPCAGRTQFAGRMGGATQDTNSPHSDMIKEKRFAVQIYIFFWSARATPHVS